MAVRFRAQRPVTRRSFLTTATSSVAIGALGSLAKPVLASPAISRAADRPAITHGIQSGDVSVDSGMVWARTDRPARMLVEVATSDSFRDIRSAVAIDALPESDFTAKALLEDLPAGEDIFYRIRFEDLASAALGEPQVGRFRTAPGDNGSVSFVWSGDTAGQGWGIDEARGGMQAYATMQRNRPDFFIHCGDIIYADCPIESKIKLPNGETWSNVVTEDKSRIAQTLADFRGNYKYNLLDGNLRAFNAEVPTFAQWDDHEVTNDWWPGQIRNDYTDRSTMLLAARARRAFHEFMPTQQTMAEAGRIYRRIGYGPMLDVFMLDMRSYRGPNTEQSETTPGRGTTILGATQLAWLKRELRKSQATWKVIAADLPIGAGQQRRGGAGGRAAARPRARDRGPAVVHQAFGRAQHDLDHRGHALHRGALLRSEPRRVPGFRAVLGVRLRPAACRHLGTEPARQHLRPDRDLRERLQRGAGREPGAVFRAAVLRACRDRRRDRRDDRDAEGRGRPGAVVDEYRTAAGSMVALAGAAEDLEFFCVPDAVQRERLTARNGAPLIRDRSTFGVRYGPGSAAHHQAVLRCARDKQKANALSIRHPEERALASLEG